MKTMNRILMSGLLALAASAAQAEVAQVKVWAAACANCHGTNGHSVGGMDSLAAAPMDMPSQATNPWQVKTRPTSHKKCSTSRQAANQPR